MVIFLFVGFKGLCGIVFLVGPITHEDQMAHGVWQIGKAAYALLLVYPLMVVLKKRRRTQQ